MHSLEHILSSHCVWEDQSLLLSSRIGFPNVSQVVMLDTYYSDLHLPLFASHYYLLLVDELMLMWSAWHLQIQGKRKVVEWTETKHRKANIVYWNWTPRTR